MANVNNPFGFRPIMRNSGAPFTLTEYAKAAAHTQALFPGDIVSKAAVSVASPFGGAPIPGCTSLQNGTPGTTLWLGAVLDYGAPATATVHKVADEPETIFIGQVDGALSVAVASHVGKNANFATGAGDALRKQSTMQIANGSIAATAGLDMRLLRLHNRPDNTEGANAILEVLIMKHANANGSAGV